MAFFSRFAALLTRPVTRSEVASPWRNRAALIALVPLALALLGVIVWAPWHSHYDIDTLTRYLQILAIADHGSGGFANGHLAGNPELTPRWTFPVNDRAWGPYPILGDYILAIAARIGGFRGIIRLLWVSLGGSCLVTYAATYRLTRRPALAVAAAYSLALATSVGFWGTMIATFLPTGAYGVTSVYLMARSFEPGVSGKRRLGLALGAGVLGSLALGSHLVWTLAWASVPLVCLFAGDRGTRLQRAGAYVVANLPGLAIMGWVNHGRFGTYNPLSYGPCNLDGCLEANAALHNVQSGTVFVLTALPYAPYVILLGLALWLVRSSKVHVGLLVGVAALAALVPETPAGTLFRNLARVLWAYLFDLGALDQGYPQWSPGPGIFSLFWRYGGPFAVRALLQCSPWIAAVFLPGRSGAAPARRATLALLGATSAGLMAGLLMRANLPGPHAIGVPFLNERYLVPALPALTILAFVAVAELPFRVWHALVAVVVGIVGATMLSRSASDNGLLRRQITHWLPLGIAFVIWVSASASRLGLRAKPRVVAGHVAALMVAVALGYGASITFGVDRLAIRAVRGFQDERAAELARCTPPKFILVGGRAMDEALAILDEKEIRYINPTMAGAGSVNTRRIISAEIAKDNPAYVIDEEPDRAWYFDWPGWKFVPIAGCPRVRRILPPFTAP